MTRFNSAAGESVRFFRTRVREVGHGRSRRKRRRPAGWISTVWQVSVTAATSTLPYEMRAAVFTHLFRLRRLSSGCLIPILVFISITSCRKAANENEASKYKGTTQVAADRFLDGYAGQTTDELIALASECRVDSIVLAFEEALNQKASRLGIDALSREEQVILAVEALEREVNNGGYHQFFINTPEHAAAVVDALIRIGCPVTAELTQAAIDELGIEGKPTAEAIEPVIYQENEARDRKLCELDGKYYEGPEDIAGQLFEFIKANQDKIGLK